MHDTTPAHLKWTRTVPESASLNLKHERLYRCEGCGEKKPLSALETRYLVRVGNIRTCKGTKCWAGYRTKAGI